MLGLRSFRFKLKGVFWGVATMRIPAFRLSHRRVRVISNTILLQSKYAFAVRDSETVF